MTEMSIDQALAYLDKFRAVYQGVSEAAEALRVAVQTKANMEMLERSLAELQEQVAAKKHELVILEQDHKKLRQRMDKQISESQAKLQEAMKRYEDEFQKVKESQEKEFEALKREHEKELEMMRQQKEGLAAEVNTLTVTKETLEQEIARLKSLITGLS